MKSILIEKPNQLAIVEREIPTPSAGEVRVKVKLAGICGSDSHIYRGHNPFAKYPRVIGHEFFGVIDAVGEGVESARVGERVAVDPVVSCGHCYPCSIGKPNVCTTLAVLGVHADGGFSEYAVVPAKNAWKIPEAVADQYAVMIEPFTIAANVTGHGQPTENDTVLVYGAGPIGLTIVQVLKGVYNVKNVIVADRIDERLEKAKESGIIFSRLTMSGYVSRNGKRFDHYRILIGHCFRNFPRIFCRNHGIFTETTVSVHT